MIEWKEISYTEGYWISNRGEVLSRRTSKEKLMKPQLNRKTGYYQIILLLNEKGGKPKRKCFTIHRLVAEHHLENPKGLNRVNHKNLDKTNNHLWNLEWVTQEENIHHYYKSNKRGKPRNMKPIECWTSEGDYIKTYPSINKAAKETGVAVSSVWDCVKGNVKNPDKYFFKYED